MVDWLVEKIASKSEVGERERERIDGLVERIAKSDVGERGRKIVNFLVKHSDISA